MRSDEPASHHLLQIIESKWAHRLVVGFGIVISGIHRKNGKLVKTRSWNPSTVGGRDVFDYELMVSASVLDVTISDLMPGQIHLEKALGDLLSGEKTA